MGFTSAFKGLIMVFELHTHELSLYSTQASAVILHEDVCGKKRSIFKLKCYADTSLCIYGYLRILPQTT